MKWLAVWCVSGLVASAPGVASAQKPPAASPAPAIHRKPAPARAPASSPAPNKRVKGVPTDPTEVGPPMRVVHVRLDSLQGYDGYSPARSLMSEVPLALRLVRVRGHVTSAMVQSNARGTWETVRLGDVTQALAIDRVAGVLKSRDGISVDELFLLKIPALGLDFLAHREGGAVLLAALFDAPAYGLTAGDLRPAEKVLGSLVAAAQQVPRTRRPP